MRAGKVFQRQEKLEVTVGVIRKVVLERGFGFLDSEGENVFFHASETPDFLRLTPGQRVEFTLEDTPKGLAAKNVRPA